MKLTNDMIETLARYSGPVTHCRPGVARADRVPRPKPTEVDRSAAGWATPPPDLKAKRRARRRAQAERQRIEARNAKVFVARYVAGQITPAEFRRALIDEIGDREDAVRDMLRRAANPVDLRRRR
jgi:hypothetical protein